ncbi:MAG: thioredoxin family protein [bacterium]|nr:thioredoxin family protein [bacterium]MDO5463188.1 thioredoxin family protein [bacterium]
MNLKSLLATVAAVTLSISLYAKDDILTQGAEAGKWTMDAPAAMQLAKTTNKPVFMCFTGSDWCGWCKLMDEKVFSTDTWNNYAKDNMVTLWLDFPRNKELVPEALRAKNEELAKNYEVQGFPTYVIADAEGNEIGRLSASREYTPETFIKDFEKIMITTKIEKILSAEDYATYKNLQAENEKLFKQAEERQEAFRQEMKALGTIVEANSAKIEALVEKAAEAITK